MYINSGYLNKSRTDFKDNSTPLVVGSCGTYRLCGIMDTLASSLRGLGYSVLPMVVSLVGSCLLRLVWIATIFQLNRTPFMLYISYPISWVLTAAVHLACLLVVRHKMRQRGQTLQAA